MLETFLMQFDLVGLTPMIFIIILDFAMAFVLLYEKLESRK